jgi:hypothetical protein
MIFRKVLRNNKRIGKKACPVLETSAFSICHLPKYNVEEMHLLMSNEKSFLFHNTVYYVAVFLIVVTASGISLPYWNWFKSTSDYNGTATATSAFGRHIFSN